MTADKKHLDDQKDKPEREAHENLALFFLLILHTFHFLCMLWRNFLLKYKRDKEERYSNFDKKE